MKISELIEKLQTTKETVGDIDVWCIFDGIEHEPMLTVVPDDNLWNDPPGLYLN